MHFRHLLLLCLCVSPFGGTWAKPEQFEFQAEVSRLMDIIVHSLYTEKEIFLRELISNASDALDKLRFLSLTDSSLLGDTKDLEIRIIPDKEAKTLTIRDTGIGMTKEDLINHLGTVAKSGTTNFLEAMSSGAGNELNLIGQFGVGFYSCFLVADKVTVASKHNDDVQYIWESTADASFTVTADENGNTLGRGTAVTLHLKSDALEFLEEDRLKNLVLKHSQFINFPVYLQVTKEVPNEEEPAEEEEKPADETEEVTEESNEETEDKEEKPATPKTHTVKDFEHVNTARPIWLRSKNEISDQEYQDFYKAISGNSVDEAMSWNHFQSEGDVQFRSILYIPKAAPFDLFTDYYGKSAALKLYVRRVLITDKFEDLMPRYLNFIRGVVDSDDLPLNVSREQLQQNKILKAMGKKLVRKALDMIKKLAENEKEEAEDEENEDEENEEEQDKSDKYLDFWKEFGKNIKLGVIEDSSNRQKLAKLLRFYSTKSGDKPVSLSEYIARMQAGQDTIYYIAGDDREQLERSPMLQAAKKRDMEVLLLTEPVDEYTMQHLNEFDGKKLQSITKGDMKFGDETEEQKEKEKQIKEKFQPLMDWWRGLLGDQVEKVTISKRLTDAPCVITTGLYGHSANMERIMKAQAFASSDKSSFMSAKKTLEINPDHKLMKELLRRAETNADDQKSKDLATLVFDAALIDSGFSLPDNAASHIYSVLSQDLSDDTDDSAPVDAKEEL